jgi:hypothetical protein
LTFRRYFIIKTAGFFCEMLILIAINVPSRGGISMQACVDELDNGYYRSNSESMYCKLSYKVQ